MVLANVPSFVDKVVDYEFTMLLSEECEKVNMGTQTKTPTEDIELTDQELLQKALMGDESAFEALFNKYKVPLFKIAFQSLGDYDQAWDILQQVFMQLFLSLSKLQTHPSLKSWLYLVTRNRCIGVVRQKKWRKTTSFSALDSMKKGEDSLPFLLSILDEQPSPEEMAVRHDIQKSISQAIQNLPPRYQAIVDLRYTQQMTYAEIGSILNIPDATVKTYFYRARILLINYLNQHGYTR